MNDDQKRFESDRAQLIKTKIAELQGRNKGMSFVQAWRILQRDHPSLFAEQPDSEQPERDRRKYDSHGRPLVPPGHHPEAGRSRYPQPTSANQPTDLAAIAKAIGIPVRVMTSKDGTELLEVTDRELDLLKIAMGPSYHLERT